MSRIASSGPAGRAGSGSGRLNEGTRFVLEAIAGVHAAATLFLTGVIWFVQVVHYPLFHHVDRAQYGRFQRAHEARTTRIVGPAMAVELVAAIALTTLGWNRLAHPSLILGLLLLAVIWLSTALLQVPRHRVLEAGYDPQAHRFLTTSNWVRTGAWSTRSALAVLLFAEAVKTTPT